MPAAGQPVRPGPAGPAKTPRPGPGPGAVPAAPARAGPRPARWRRLGWVSLAAMAAAQVASVHAGHLEIFVSAIVAALALASVGFTAAQVGSARTGAAAAAACALGLAAEWAGTRTGLPFGAYRYTGLLRPAVGTVPLVVPLAWAAMGLPSYRLGCAIGRGRAARVIAGAVALTAWDLFLDPQMLRAGFWRWDHPGGYQGVPLSNFAGWLLVSAALMAALDRLLRPRLGSPARPLAADRGLLASYTVMAVMETVAFAAIFPHGRVVALAGAVGMAIPAVLAWAGSGRPRADA
jgi:uncharacterized membrane protein